MTTVTLGADENFCSQSMAQVKSKHKVFAPGENVLMERKGFANTDASFVGKSENRTRGRTNSVDNTYKKSQSTMRMEDVGNTRLPENAVSVSADRSVNGHVEHLSTATEKPGSPETMRMSMQMCDDNPAEAALAVEKDSMNESVGDSPRSTDKNTGKGEQSLKRDVLSKGQDLEPAKNNSDREQKSSSADRTPGPDGGDEEAGDEEEGDTKSVASNDAENGGSDNGDGNRRQRPSRRRARLPTYDVNLLTSTEFIMRNDPAENSNKDNGKTKEKQEKGPGGSSHNKGMGGKETETEGSEESDAAKKTNKTKKIFKPGDFLGDFRYADLRLLCAVILEQLQEREPRGEEEAPPVSIDWQSVSALLRLRDHKLKWPPALCQRLWKYIAYGKDFGVGLAKQQEGDRSDKTRPQCALPTGHPESSLCSHTQSQREGTNLKEENVSLIDPLQKSTETSNSMEIRVESLDSTNEQTLKTSELGATSSEPLVKDALSMGGPKGQDAVETIVPPGEAQEKSESPGDCLLTPSDDEDIGIPLTVLLAKQRQRCIQASDIESQALHALSDCESSTAAVTAQGPASTFIAPESTLSPSRKAGQTLESAGVSEQPKPESPILEAGLTLGSHAAAASTLSPHNSLEDKNDTSCGVSIKMAIDNFVRQRVLNCKGAPGQRKFPMFSLEKERELEKKVASDSINAKEEKVRVKEKVRMKKEEKLRLRALAKQLKMEQKMEKKRLREEEKLKKKNLKRKRASSAGASSTMSVPHILASNESEAVSDEEAHNSSEAGTKARRTGAGTKAKKPTATTRKKSVKKTSDAKKGRGAATQRGKIMKKKAVAKVTRKGSKTVVKGKGKKVKEEDDKKKKKKKQVTSKARSKKKEEVVSKKSEDESEEESEQESEEVSEDESSEISGEESESELEKESESDGESLSGQSEGEECFSGGDLDGYQYFIHNGQIIKMRVNADARVQLTAQSAHNNNNNNKGRNRRSSAQDSKKKKTKSRTPSATTKRGRKTNKKPMKRTPGKTRKANQSRASGGSSQKRPVKAKAAEDEGSDDWNSSEGSEVPSSDSDSAVLNELRRAHRSLVNQSKSPSKKPRGRAKAKADSGGEPAKKRGTHSILAAGSKKQDVGGGAVRKEQGKEPKKPKRYLTPRCLYVRQMAVVRAEDEPRKDAVARLNREWDTLNEEQKKPFVEKSTQEKNRFQREMKRWKEAMLRWDQEKPASGQEMSPRSSQFSASQGARDWPRVTAQGGVQGWSGAGLAFAEGALEERRVQQPLAVFEAAMRRNWHNGGLYGSPEKRDPSLGGDFGKGDPFGSPFRPAPAAAASGGTLSALDPSALQQLLAFVPSTAPAPGSPLSLPHARVASPRDASSGRAGSLSSSPSLPPSVSVSLPHPLSLPPSLSPLRHSPAEVVTSQRGRRGRGGKVVAGLAATAAPRGRGRGRGRGGAAAAVDNGTLARAAARPQTQVQTGDGARGERGQGAGGQGGVGGISGGRERGGAGAGKSAGARKAGPRSEVDVGGAAAAANDNAHAETKGNAALGPRANSAVSIPAAASKKRPASKGRAKALASTVAASSSSSSSSSKITATTTTTSSSKTRISSTTPTHDGQQHPASKRSKAAPARTTPLSAHVSQPISKLPSQVHTAASRRGFPSAAPSSSSSPLPPSASSSSPSSSSLSDGPRAPSTYRPTSPQSSSSSASAKSRAPAHSQALSALMNAAEELSSVSHSNSQLEAERAQKQLSAKTKTQAIKPKSAQRKSRKGLLDAQIEADTLPFAMAPQHSQPRERHGQQQLQQQQQAQGRMLAHMPAGQHHMHIHAHQLRPPFGSSFVSAGQTQLGGYSQDAPHTAGSCALSSSSSSPSSLSSFTSSSSSSSYPHSTFSYPLSPATAAAAAAAAPSYSSCLSSSSAVSSSPSLLVSSSLQGSAAPSSARALAFPPGGTSVPSMYAVPPQGQQGHARPPLPHPFHNL